MGVAMSRSGPATSCHAFLHVSDPVACFDIASTSHQHAIVISLTVARPAAESFIVRVDSFTCVALAIS